MFSTFMEVLDTTVVNVSLPHIAGNLSATIDESTWVLTSYLVANAVILPLTGWLASTFGRKRLLMASVTGFTLSSLLCGIAPSLPFLVGFRLMQGATGGALQPLSQAILPRSVPSPRARQSHGLLGAGDRRGADTRSGARRLADGYVQLALGFLYQPARRHRIDRDDAALRIRSALSAPDRERIDYWGIGLLALWVATLQLALDLGQEHDWFSSPFIVGLVVTCAIGLVAFLAREWLAAEPVIDLRVFKVRSYATGVFLMTTLGFVLYGSLVLLPMMLQTLLGYPALQAGIAMAPRGLGSFIGMPMVGLLIGKVDPRKLVAAGLIMGATTLFWLGGLNLEAGYWDIFWPQFFQGLGLSAVFVPLTTISMDPIPRERMGNATSLFNLMRNLGGSIGIATTGTILARRQQEYINVMGAHVNPFSPAATGALDAAREGFIAGGADPVTATHRAYAALFGAIQQQAAMVSFVEIFRLLGTIFLCLLPLILLMRRPRSSAAPAGAH